MERVNQKLATLVQALKTLDESIVSFDQYKKKFLDSPLYENEKLAVSMRDSMIQRFEYCTDLFWKVLKLHLEDVEKIDIAAVSPRGVMREAIKVKILSEAEGALCMDMVVNRNKTSHIYHQEMADIIARNVPQFYALMYEVAERLSNATQE
jgi:nucleotidyltransferase substrate binding protein (TIGR01987 family)